MRPRPSRFIVRSGGTERAVSLDEEGTFRVDGSSDPYTVSRRSGTEYRVAATDRAWPVWTAADGKACWVFLDGRTFRITIARPGSRRAGGAQAHETLTAPMPATVTEVRASVGATVKAGDPLVVLEAMKMELLVRAPHDGKVTVVHCSAGDLVQPDVPLIELG